MLALNMYNIGVLNAVSRFVVNNVVPTRNICTNVPLRLNVTNVLFAEPLKKKKKMDPAIIRAKEDRRKRKLEKHIRKLEKHARQLKPIIELEVPTWLKDELEIRKRELPPLPEEEKEKRAKIMNEWNVYKTKQHLQTVKLIDRLVAKQEKALAALRVESEERYQEAIQIDPNLLPFSAKGPTVTPPIEGYEPPDGEYIDITRKFEGEM